MDTAQQQVMAEYQSEFELGNVAVLAGVVEGECPPRSDNKYQLGVWNPDAICGEFTAQSRADWLVENCAFDVETSQQQVMAEYPFEFVVEGECPKKNKLRRKGRIFGTWYPDAICDEYTAQSRAEWLVENCGFDLNSAQQQVMAEYPSMFAHSDDRRRLQQVAEGECPSKPD